MNWPQKPYGVLVADDSADDRLFLRLALERVPAFRLLAEAENGRQAIAYLHQEEPWEDSGKYPWPDLLLLDLKMPHLDGISVLKWLRGQPSRPLSVIVLSGSFLDLDKEDSVRLGVRLGANAFFSKSWSIPTMEGMLKKIECIMDRNAGTPLEELNSRKKVGALVLVAGRSLDALSSATVDCSIERAWNIMPNSFGRGFMNKIIFVASILLTSCVISVAQAQTNSIIGGVMPLGWSANQGHRFPAPNSGQLLNLPARPVAPSTPAFDYSTRKSLVTDPGDPDYIARAQRQAILRTAGPGYSGDLDRKIVDTFTPVPIKLGRSQAQFSIVNTVAKKNPLCLFNPNILNISF